MGAEAAKTAPTKVVRSYRLPKPVGPHSQRIALGAIDGRLREAKLMKEITEELLEHCGGQPSAVQKRLIQRTAMLHLRLAHRALHELEVDIPEADTSDR